MGQYYYVVNLDKRQYLHPHKFDEGLKLLEFGCGSEGVLTALTILLADGNGRGGGDFDSTSPLVGSWAGDRIVISGDYADPGFDPLHPGENLYSLCANEEYEGLYEDISYKVRGLMFEDSDILNEAISECSYNKQHIVQSLKHNKDATEFVNKNYPDFLRDEK